MYQIFLKWWVQDSPLSLLMLHKSTSVQVCCEFEWSRQSWNIHSDSQITQLERGKGGNIAAGALRLRLGVPQEFFLGSRRRKGTRDARRGKMTEGWWFIAREYKKTFTHQEICVHYKLGSLRVSIQAKQAAEDLREESPTTLFSLILDFFTSRVTLDSSRYVWGKRIVLQRFHQEGQCFIISLPSHPSEGSSAHEPHCREFWFCLGFSSRSLGPSHRHLP